jgi:hypothetical protein
MSDSRLPFIDWMKCLGMLVIVYGHTAGDYVLHVTDPFNPKQLGVAFFVFVMGFSLAGETRAVGRTLYNRLFEVYLFGGLFALLMSCIMYVRFGDLNESNYLPMLLGANVFFDHFPANPTTWYIGTYLHLLIVWWLVLRGRQLRTWVFALVVLLEIPTRAWLIQHAGNYIAYMLLFNWLGIFLLGTIAGQRRLDNLRRSRSMPLHVAALVGLLLVWPQLSATFDLQPTFPFMRIGKADTYANLLVTSASVSMLYLAFTWLTFQITSRLGDSSLVRFFARNTVIIFIAHMPLLYALAPHVNRLIAPGWTRAIVNLLIYFVALGLVSEVIRRATQPNRLRELILAKMHARFAGAACLPVGSQTDA